MNKEKIVKALECCADGCHNGCPYANFDVDGYSCETLLCRDALTLIEERDEFLKWLAEYVMREDFDVMAELICRKLYKVGYIDTDCHDWTVVDDEL